MLKPLQTIITFVVVFILMTVYIGICFIPLVSLKILKTLVPFKNIKQRLKVAMDRVAETWIKGNSVIYKIFLKTNWIINGGENLKPNGSYILICNHQSWVDILTLQKIFVSKIPFLRFFMKKSLIWVPFVGQACWVMDFPFVNRFSKQYIDKYPHKKGKDLEITKKFCQKFVNEPITVTNFIEGTRYTKKKHKIQKAPFNNLLKPKAGGLAFVLSSLNNQVDGIINVTICYPNKTPSFVDFMANKVNKIIVDIELIPLTDEYLGDYFNDSQYSEEFKVKLNSIWQKKDALIDSLSGVN